MIEFAGWQFDLEVHPADWHFPAGPTWLAGWIFAGNQDLVTDLRAWVDGRPFLGLPGLPKPGLDEKFLGRPGPPYAGFTIRVEPQRGATRLRLEFRNAQGTWTEFFRTAITAAPDAPAGPVPAALSFRLTTLLPAILRARSQRPSAAWAELADEAVADAIAVPLSSLPNPPFHGALEEPSDYGRLRYGRLAVTGWLAHRTEKIRRLTALADAVQESTLLHGLARTDIGTVFADLPGRDQSQFIGQADLPARPGGWALLKVFAELENGEKHLAFAQRFHRRIIAGSEAPLPPLSRFMFGQALWALCGAARRHGLPLGAGPALASATRVAWSEYRAAAPVPPRPAPASAGSNSPGLKPLRLLVVTHNLNFEGAPRLVFELARHLGRQPGSSVRVLAPQEGPMRHVFEAAGMPVEVVEVTAALAAASPAEFRLALSTAVTTDWNQVDLVLANTLVSFWGVHAAQWAGKPSLFYVHESAPISRFFGPLLPPTLLPLVELALREATRVVFTADASRAVFAAYGAGRNYRVLPSWLDIAAIDTFAAAHPKAELRAQQGIDPAAVVLLNLGTVCERKGQHTFIRAAELLEPELRQRRRDGPVEFVMVGARADDFQALLRLQVADAKLSGVRFVPETRENFAWLRLADILVCTSFEESSPRVLLEAAAFGLPIVSTDVNGIPELVTAEEAWLVQPGDPHQLAGAIRAALAAQRAGDIRRVTRARAKIAARFDEAVSLPQHLALANEAVANYP